MINKSKSKVGNMHKAKQSLSHVVLHSESIKEIVQECAEDLSTVNTVLKKEMPINNTQPSIKNALIKNETVENQVQLVVDELDIVNNALKVEVKERELIAQALEEVILEKDIATQALEEVTLEKEIATQALEEVTLEKDIATQALEEVTLEKDIATQAALHDALTGLPNRALFYDRLEHGLEQAKRHGWNLAVMFLDLDKFKQINDDYGHDVGDKVLLSIATRLKNTIRKDDTICRLGGDEFLYLLMEVKDKRGVVNVIKKLIKTIEMPCIEIEPNLVVKPSIGVAMFPENGDNLEELIKNADAAMYAAKNSDSSYAFA